ncbi:MAG TPA: carboxypeptidase regulatory-like domain-containing protein [Jatrophihabitantaceae bacterium]
MVTAAGLAVAVAAPAAASPAAPPTSPSAKQTANYLPASCNTTQPSSKGRDFARCYALIHTNSSGKVVPNDSAPPASALGPAQIQNAYNLPASGQGQTVAVVDAFGYSTAEADLAVFRSQYGLPPCTTANGCFKKVDQTGGTNYPADDPGWALESALDLDAVSSACPACNIMLVEGNDNGFDSLGVAVDTAVSLGAKFVSNSYGVAGEMPNEQTYDHYYNHPGVAVTASTGDAGNVPNWPAANPNVIAVAGTTLAADSSTRGWHETAWDGGGSGCSPFEPRPDYQQTLNTNCPNNRAQGDISADADPASGLAVYDSIASQFGVNWLQIGGTSLSSPLTAAMYALAGTPVPGTYPVTYPYQAPQGSINDITEGTNGGCGNVLCTAGPGWDGPTGLGTPNGVTALTTGPHGDIAGKVTDSGTGAPVKGATVKTADGYADTTEADGSYDLSVPVGTYDVTAQAFGYQAKTTAGVVVTDAHTTALDAALASVPSQNVSGTVTDGSGHGWPLYAKITIDGYPGGAFYTDPYTGYYSVDLPQDANYTLHITPVAQGYATKDLSVAVGDSDEVANTNVTVDATTCVAPGYAYKYTGTGEQFAGWTGSTTKDGWTNVDNKGNAQTWQFDNPGNRAVPPGGDSEFAIIDSDHYGISGSQDSSLVSPVANLSSQTAPEIGFDTYYNGYTNSVGDVDLSIDGGATWSNVWHKTTTSVQGHVAVPIPQAAGQTAVQVRFHYTGSFAWWWEIDNVFVGTRTCAAQHGGLVAGIVHDNNTGNPINGAKVASGAAPADFGVSAPTPDDANVSDGFYWLFSSLTGSRQFTASDGKYVAASSAVNVATNYVTHRDWTLKAGHVSVTPASVSVSETLGVAKSKNVKLTNDGTEPVHVKLSEQNGAFTPMGQSKPASTMPGAPLQTVKASTSFANRSKTQVKPQTTPLGVQPRGTTPSAPPWADIANYPKKVMDNAVATSEDGKVYSFGGSDGTAAWASSYVYDPDAQQWTPIADLPEPLNGAAAVPLGGKIYVIGGWAASGNASAHVYAYDPSGNSWSQVADLPKSVSGAAATTLNGQLYVVGGCTTGNCAPTSNSTFSFDPGSNSWSQEADYPGGALAFLGCGGVGGEVVCAGGIDAATNAGSKSTYAFTPGAGWTKVADMPVDDWAMSYYSANGKFQIVGGAINNGASLTNQALEYDPAADAWSALPNANNAAYRGGGGCGLYKIGGSSGGFSAQSFAETLPGYSQCGAGADVPWLSESTTEFDLPAGTSVTVSVTMDSSVVPQPGAYTGKVAISTDTPYSVPAVGATMQVNPPAAWGKITGAVTAAVGGAPIAGATVQIGTFSGTGQVTFTLKTDNTGHYQLWLDARYSPLQIIAAKDGYQPQVKTVKITKGTTTTSNFALKKS